jgi:LSD1 subclass zinc finger protein
VPLSLLLGGFLFLCVVRPVLLVANARRVARVRQMLQAALAARPPERPGGPATCRSCGAPLDVPEGALGVRCVYCREHNLVAIPESWIARARKASKQLGVHLSEASVERAAG